MTGCRFCLPPGALHFRPRAKITSPVAGCGFRKVLDCTQRADLRLEVMKVKKTLSQVCAELNVSRRAIQGYEKIGLVSPAGKNKYGHLLYGDPEQERIRIIRFYQQLGFTLKEIKVLLSSCPSERKAAIRAKVTELEAKNVRLQELIRQAEEHIATL